MRQGRIKEGNKEVEQGQTIQQESKKRKMMPRWENDSGPPKKKNPPWGKKKEKIQSKKGKSVPIRYKGEETETRTKRLRVPRSRTSFIDTNLRRKNVLKDE